MKQNRIAFTIADENNLKYAEGLKNSLKKTNPKLELRIFGPEEIKQTNDPHIFYRATPYFGLYLMQQGYEEVVKLDADQIITGDINHIWEGDYDIATVNNSNPIEVQKLQVAVQGVHPLEYQNCGFVVMKNQEFVKFWLSMCMSPRFGAFQYREQDILNNIIFWGRWKVRFLDQGNKFHGLASKGYELQMELKDGKLVLPAVKDGYPNEEKQIVCYHEAGGNNPNKLNLNLKFKPKVSKWLNDLRS